MTNNGFQDCRSTQSRRPDGTTSRLSVILKHVTFALTRHVRQLHEGGLPVPPEVEELAALLMCLVRLRQDSPISAWQPSATHDVAVPERLLVTKSEAAERLGVSVRTIERLVAAGRLPQVHVERLARFRVSDLEAFSNNLGQEQGHDADSEGRNGRG